MTFQPQKPPQRHRSRGRIATTKEIDKGTTELQKKRISFEARICKKVANQPTACWARILFHNKDISKKQYILLKRYSYLRLRMYESDHPLHIHSSWRCEKIIFSSKKEKMIPKEIEAQWNFLYHKIQSASHHLMPFLDFLTLDAITYEENAGYYNDIKEKANHVLLLLEKIMDTC